jgi:hypothetical protein
MSDTGDLLRDDELDEELPGAHDELSEAVATIMAAVERAKEGGTQSRIELYARLEELGVGITTLLQIERERPDEQLVLFVRRLLELLVGRFRHEANDVVRYLLGDAPGNVLVAITKAAIEEVRGASEDSVRGVYEAVINAARDIARNTDAEESIETMFREARDGRR